jgi:hypothetical protein
MQLVRGMIPLIALTIASSVLAQSNGSPTRTEAAISAADVRARIAFLASDALRGRDTPSPGLETAAQYIANEFKALGLQPLGDSGTFIQRYPYDRRELKATGARVELRAGDTGQTLRYLQQYFLLPGPIDTASAPVMFAGTAPLQAVQLPASARGRIVAYYMPGKGPQGEWLERARASVLGAVGAQPAGLIMILDPEFSPESIGMIASSAGGEQLPFLIAGVSYAAAKEWFARAGQDLDALRNAATPAEVSGLAATMSVQMDGTTSRPPNVVALLPGSDPALKDTYIIFSAHMDHVGVGQPNAKGDSIFNGADDDASGTSAVLEVAQAFARLPPKPKRSIIFLTVSGEEKGLLGSDYFASHLPVPAEKVVADINIDMIGRNNPDTVVAIGQEYTTLGETVQQVAKANSDLKLKVAPDLWPQEQLFFRSDHFSFAKRKIPAIFFTTGLHDDYHQPSDEPQTIDVDKLARIARLVYHLGFAVSDASTPPKWTEQGIAALRAAGVAH